MFCSSAVVDEGCRLLKYSSGWKALPISYVIKSEVEKFENLVPKELP
jgi:hypothetical protein